ncbi:polyphosphate polymerase domain-containing protein [Psychroserpens sp.]|uniref:polyphosphate polymerase domain-containing protein n=1 Tax=Psychroserpens sp. TaxID=2020870 RepID=UPI001B0F8DA2|nr:polyphosphate polymerase domain-containing protein [Psychroserpens sp.]MBO6605389.1 polyphosphate polymerase domain-containing protein [Psychroserpens sp.]MBO6630165.1 polyphosphate polymerase domain-containing protein [Psychroserpens sp.]MBO6653802.1 polyphosphate polymerase domain-containing protein [Psychroserpens sp.]MBO6748763.1 polyphosphate polymerase domain-containing protein [Psychroserpens sp.]MBO6915282.1 polyphosphate polymerase domain-containing protein [Psychroserpens sp.]
MVKVANKGLSEVHGQNLRYERKFIFEKTEPEDLIEEVLSNSFGFNEVFYRRTINNIYYDDNKFSYYHQNVAGDGHREKCRIRWYGDTFSEINNPTFEIKKKFGEVGDKISFKLKNHKTSIDQIDIKQFDHLLFEGDTEKNVSVIGKFQQLVPTLYNTYERRYFLSFCQKFRITIDYNMQFYNPNYNNFSSSNMSIPYDEVVLELKYNLEHDQESRLITQQFNTRLSKNSKYVRGVELVHH